LIIAQLGRIASINWLKPQTASSTADKSAWLSRVEAGEL
jgi:hypothetical protein